MVRVHYKYGKHFVKRKILTCNKTDTMRLTVVLLCVFVLVALTVAKGPKQGKNNKGQEKEKENKGNNPNWVTDSQWYQYWLEKFCRKSFWFPWSKDFTSERIPLERTVVGSCTVDVGTCPVGSCHFNTRRHFQCPPDGVICPKTEAQTVECGVFGSQEVEVVTECVCCKDEGINVEGTVTADDTGDPLENISILVSGTQEAVTNDQGEFVFNIQTGTSFVAIVARDTSGTFLDAVKTVDIPEGFQGPVSVDITMLRSAAPLAITDPGVDTTFSFSANPEDPALGVAQITIPANSLTDANGNIVTDPAEISINFVDASAPEENIPGRFETVDGDQLISDGLFNIDVRDSAGNELSGNIVITVRTGMTLWNLDPQTNVWTQANILNRRRRRQVSLTEDLLVEINNRRWVNIDKIPGAPRCYFKARVFFQNPADAANPANYQPGVLAFTPNNERLRIYTPYTTTPNDTCFEVRCLAFDAAQPANVLIGFINMTVAESVNIGGVNIPQVTTLTPKNLADYIPAIETAHTSVQYAVAPNQKEIFVNFISSVSGPFYQDRATCEASSITQPAFHFYKPELPSYVSGPADTEFCTARILFRDGYLFEESLANLTSLPEVTAISTWNSNGTNYFDTDTTVLSVTTNGNGSFYFVCIEYRCGSVDEPTTVYIGIEAPLIEVNFTDYEFYDDNTANATGNTTTMVVPAFTCYGTCNSDLCYQAGSNINGTLTVESNGPSGPDFYNNTSNDCAMRQENEPFAFEFYCYGNYGRYGQSNT